MAQILEQIKLMLTKAVKEKDEQTVSALRFFLADFHNEEIVKQKELTDEELQAVIKRQVKKHLESIEAFQKGGREDLAQKEEKEKKILEAFLPAQLPEEEIHRVVSEVISSGARDFGQIMSQVMGKLKGQVDGAVVARIVKEELEHG